MQGLRHYFIITILLLGNRTHQRIYIYNSLPLFRRTLLPPTGAIPLTGLVRQNIYNVWLSLINLSTVTGLPPRVRWCDRLVASGYEPCKFKTSEDVIAELLFPMLSVGDRCTEKDDGVMNPQARMYLKNLLGRQALAAVQTARRCWLVHVTCTSSWRRLVRV